MVVTSIKKILSAQVSAQRLLAIEASVCRTAFMPYLCKIDPSRLLSGVRCGKAELNTAHRTMVFGI